MKLDGMKFSDAIDLLLKVSTSSTPEPKITKEKSTTDEPSRNFGFCQMCEYTIGNCICEDGPY